MRIFLFLGLILVLSLVQSSIHNDYIRKDDGLETSEIIMKVNNKPEFISNTGDNKSGENYFLLKLNSDIVALIGKFLSVVPQRELGRIDKSFSKIFLRNHSFHRIISEYFDIPEMLLAERNDDLLWFQDKFRVFKKDPNHFFILLLYALIVDKQFYFNSKLLCYYVTRVYKRFNLELFRMFYWNNRICVCPFYDKFAIYLYEQQYYDVWSLFSLSDPGFPLIDTNDILSLIQCTLRLPFFQNLFLDSNGLATFYKFYDLGNSILIKSYLISVILATDKSVEILISCLNNLNNVKDKKKLIGSSFYYLFFENFQDCLNFEIDELNEFYQRNLLIFSHPSIVVPDLKLYVLLNEIYFGPFDVFTDNFIIKNLSLNIHIIKCSFQKNRNGLFSRLLNLQDKCKYNLTYQIKNFFKPNSMTINSIYDEMRLFFVELSETNFKFFMMFYEKYQETKFKPIHHDNDFKMILKFYFITDFIEIFEQRSNFSINMELKQQYRNQNWDLPFKFVYNYKCDYNLANLYDVLMNFSGSNENSLIQLIKVVRELNGNLYFFVSDIVVKMISDSENLRDSFSSDEFIILIDSKQLMRLLKLKLIKLEDLIIINNLIRYEINDFDCIGADSDFTSIEILTDKSILDHVINIVKCDLCEKFKTFIKIRKALHYLLKINRESLKRIEDRVIIEFLKKEAPEDIEDIFSV